MTLRVQSIVEEPVWGHVRVFRVPTGYQLPVRGSSVEAWDDFYADRRRWEVLAKSNTITVFGKSYLWRFATRANDRITNAPHFTTSSLEQDDFVSFMALGDGGTGPPDPAAFTVASDSIQSYRGRGPVTRSVDLPDTDAPHAVEIEARFTGPDIVNPTLAEGSFSFNEAALVPYSSDDHNGTYPGNKVIAYCTFPDEAVPVALADTITVEWVLGIG